MAAREKDRAESFAAEFGIPKSFGSYEELANLPDVGKQNHHLVSNKFNYICGKTIH